MFEGAWFDFWNLQTYYKSKRYITTQRAFNDIAFTQHAVTKTSSDPHKIEAEATWYENLPVDLRVFTPQYLGSVRDAPKAGYRTATSYHPTLSELFVFGRVKPFVWRKILDACGDFVDVAARHKSDRVTPDEVAELYLPKTLSRLDAFSKQRSVDLRGDWTINGINVPTPYEIAEEVASHIEAFDSRYSGVMHGDFCFSNIFYDFGRDGISVIDPRGYINARYPSVHGDIRYDVAKLCHSVVGRYDFIVAGFYELQQIGERRMRFIVRDGDHARAVEDDFLSRSFAGYATSSRSCWAITIMLFLSMLPLHYDRPDRQMAFLANALRLYDLFRRER